MLQNVIFTFDTCRMFDCFTWQFTRQITSQNNPCKNYTWCKWRNIESSWAKWSGSLKRTRILITQINLFQHREECHRIIRSTLHVSTESNSVLHKEVKKKKEEKIMKKKNVFQKGSLALKPWTQRLVPVLIAAPLRSSLLSWQLILARMRGRSMEVQYPQTIAGGQCCRSWWPVGVSLRLTGPSSLHFLQDAPRNMPWNSLGLDIFVLQLSPFRISAMPSGDCPYSGMGGMHLCEMTGLYGVFNPL